MDAPHDPSDGGWDERRLGKRPPAAPIPRGRLLGAVLALTIVGIAIAVIRSRDLDAEMVGAVHAGDVAAVKALLAEAPELANAKVYPQGSNTDPSRRRWDGKYVIYDAIGLADDPTEILELLVSHGADLGARFHGRTLLHQAAFHGNMAALAWLIDHGADVNARVECDSCAEKGRAPLHDAQHFRDREASLLLLDRGATVDAADARGRTALHASAEEGSPVGAMVLCAHGSDPARRDAGGQTPHELAQDIDRRGRSTTHTEILGPGELADWLRPGGGCARLAALAASGAAIDEETMNGVFREFACARGHQNSCPVS